MTSNTIDRPTITCDQDGLDRAKAMAVGIQRTLRIARGLRQAGRDIDLHGLDNMIGALCARTLDLPPGYAHALRPQLVEILAELDILSAAVVPTPEE